jgi:hypothetical protein
VPSAPSTPAAAPVIGATGLVDDARAPLLTARIQTQHAYPRSRGATLSPTGLLAVFGSTSQISIWDVNTGKLARVIATPFAEVSDVSWPTSGDQIVSTGELTGTRTRERHTILFSLTGNEVGRMSNVLHDYAEVPGAHVVQRLALARLGGLDLQVVYWTATAIATGLETPLPRLRIARGPRSSAIEQPIAVRSGSGSLQLAAVLAGFSERCGVPWNAVGLTP